MKFPIKTLLFSTLFPSSIRPVHGIFVETRLRELLKSGEVETKVVAPVPWFPFKSKRFGEYAQFASTPKQETWNGIEVHHPRYFLPPKIGMNIAPYTMANAALPTIKRLIQQGFDFDLIDAHYYYPDGVAAGFIAKQLGKPFVITSRGTDLNLIANYARPRKLILETAELAVASIGVCQALMKRLEKLGAKPEKLNVLRNGVDLDRFQPVDRGTARSQLGLPSNTKILLSVGHLIERKGNQIAIGALAELTDCLLIIVGIGPEYDRLQILAKEIGVSNRVRFVGQIPNDKLKWYYSAANALILCSSREGWANVLLESMACGTPVVATNIWGTPEVVASDDVGQLMSTRDIKGLVQAVNKLFESVTSEIVIRHYAKLFSWQATTEGQIALFKKYCLKDKFID